MSEQNGDSSLGTMSSLEDRLNSLEALVTKLESGQMSIDAAIESYTQGMKLAASCKKSLDEMTQKVTFARKEAAKLIGDVATDEVVNSSSKADPKDLVPF